MKAYDTVWFVGDQFFSETFTQYFQNASSREDKTSYIRAYYDTIGYCQVEGLNRNIFSRLRNAVVEGINKQVLLPKVILLVFENDILDYLDHYRPGVSTLIGQTIEWLANQLHRMITSHKEKLPSKSRKFKYPVVMMCGLPHHCEFGKLNEFRDKFNTCLQSTTSLFREMHYLEMVWDSRDTTLFTRGNLNSKGYAAYWQSVNEAFEKWDREQMKSLHSAPKTPVMKSSSSCGTNVNKKPKPSHYREFVADTNKFKWDARKTMFKLPKPQSVKIKHEQ